MKEVVFSMKYNPGLSLSHKKERMKQNSSSKSKKWIIIFMNKIFRLLGLNLKQNLPL